MVMHEEFLDGNFSSFEELRKANLEQAARPQTAQVRRVLYWFNFTIFL